MFFIISFKINRWMVCFLSLFHSFRGFNQSKIFVAPRGNLLTIFALFKKRDQTINGIEINRRIFTKSNCWITTIFFVPSLSFTATVKFYLQTSCTDANMKHETKNTKMTRRVPVLVELSWSIDFNRFLLFLFQGGGEVRSSPQDFLRSGFRFWR